MLIVKKAKIKCPEKNCKADIMKEWNIGVLPRLLSMGALFFKCRKCSNIFHINLPLYLTNKFLDAMPKDPEYRDGDFITRTDPVTDEEEELFMKMLREKPSELLDALQSIEKIDLKNYE